MKKFKNEDYKTKDIYIPKIYDPIKLSYLAGIVDGEGCFNLCRLQKNPKDGYVAPHFRGVLKVSNTDIKLFHWLQETFAGTCSAAFKETRDKLFKRDCYEWIVSGHRLLDLSRKILPYLVIKKAHCENMIKFRETFPSTLGRGNKMVTPENIQIRQDCVDLMHKLNARVRQLPHCKVL